MLNNLVNNSLLYPPSSRRTQEWDTAKIREFYPSQEESILKLQPSLTGAPNRLCWLGTRPGAYTTKSRYETAVAGTSEPSEGDLNYNWNRDVWALKTAPKIKMLIWKALKGAIPVGTGLVERHVPVEVSCKKCGNPESIIHLFFQCPFAREVWQSAPFCREIDYSGAIDLKEL